MAHMVSPAGDMEVNVTKVGAAKGKMFIEGQIGVWDSQIYFERKEIAHLIGMAMKPAVLWFVISLPFVRLGQKIRGEKKQQS
jgi:hypothetical protein